MKKSNVQAIFPLTFMQQALLLHSLQEQRDEGLLHVQCKLTGPLDLNLFKQAWQQTVQRHSVLRTSVHWKDLEKPVQVIQRQSILNWVLHDWSDLSADQQKEQLTNIKKADLSQGLNLSKAPVSRLMLIKMSEQAHYLVWTCHHILFDGWSAAIVLQDSMAYYDGACKGKMVQLEAIPAYKTYFNWLGRQDMKAAEGFWKERLEGFHEPSLIAEDTSTTSNEFKVQSFSLDVEASRQLEQYARKKHVTFNTLLNGMWALLLGRLLQKEDIGFGMTVSGRSGDLPNLELMAGLFSNLLPVRIQIAKGQRISEWLSNIQKQYLASQRFEQVTLGQIESWIKRPGHLPLFDSLLVFENFPWKELKGGELAVSEFSGGFTTTYPLTMVVLPGDTLHFSLYYKEDIPEEVIHWIESQFSRLPRLLQSLTDASVDDLLQQIAPSTYVRSNAVQAIAVHPNGKAGNGQLKDYVAPQNKIELQLSSMWEELLGKELISVTDNFFEIGGKSLLALRLLNRINTETPYKTSPATLMQNPTIRGLANVLTGDHSDSWSSMVPLRTSGSQTPLFCIHGGGAHVFFYNLFAKAMSPDRPIYAMQPVGLDGDSAFHSSIEEMASHYLKEIRSIQPHGPYAFLSYCFSNAVGLEMAQQLKKVGEEVGQLIIVDSIVPTNTPKKVEKTTAVQNLTKLLKDGNWKTIYRRLQGRVQRLTNKVNGKEVVEEKSTLTLMQESLGNILSKYIWKPYDGNITVIISTQFKDLPGKQEQIETTWKDIAGDKVSFRMVDGRHRNLFKDPDVYRLAEQVTQCLEHMPQKQTEAV
ncbi:MAG: condensation domain-containing protein [Bacteroidota bacterium]